MIPQSQSSVINCIAAYQYQHIVFSDRCVQNIIPAVAEVWTRHGASSLLTFSHYINQEGTTYMHMHIASHYKTLECD
jgi:hypothetical protein